MLEKIPQSVEGFELEEIDGEILLYSPSSTRSVYLNSTASLIWQLCDGKQSIKQIITQLQKAFKTRAGVFRALAFVAMGQ